MAQLKLIRSDDGFDLPRLGREDGSAFGFFDRWNLGTTPDGRYIVDMADWEARDLHEMLDKDYKAAQIANVLSLPIMSAKYDIQPTAGDTGEAEWLRKYWDADRFSGGCRTGLHQIIDMMTSAFWYKRAYFEKIFAKGVGDFEGKIVYEDVAWRPQTTCRIMRDPKNGRFEGFEQEAYYLGPEITHMKKWPIQVRKNRAFVYIHGTHRDPLNGTSDMNVAYWAWKTKQKVLMLWFQFLQGVSLPKVIVRASDSGTARDVAKEIARMKSSGVLPVSTPGGPESVGIDSLDLSGKGAEQFREAIRWLDQCATQAVLAGFLDLTDAAANGAGSYALSNDASSFYLQSLEAKVREMENQIREKLFAPLIFHNFGIKAKIPKLVFEPLNDTDKDVAVDLLKTSLAQPPGSPVPTEYISLLAEMVANHLGLDGEAVKESFKKSFDAAAEQAAQEAAAEAGGETETGQNVARMAGATKAASEAVKAGLSPKEAMEAAKRDEKTDGAESAEKKKRRKELADAAKKAMKAKTGN